MHEAAPANEAVAEQSPAAAAGRAAERELGPLAERALALQQTAGNAAVLRLLARQPTATAKPALPPGVQPGADKVTVTDLSFACIFSGGNPLYQTQARRFIGVAMPEDRIIDAGSMQEAVAKMLLAARAAQKGGKPVRIVEIVIVAHANSSGFIRMPLVPGSKGTTLTDFAKLQSEFAAGSYDRFQGDRAELIGLIDSGTTIIVRGCELAAQVPGIADAFAAFFGGQPTVYVSKEYQGFSRMRIGGPVIKTKEQAYDFLEAHNYIPYGEAYTKQEKERWVDRHLPDGYVPEMFFLHHEDKAAALAGGPDDPKVQPMKQYDEATAYGDERYFQQSSGTAADDETLDGLSTQEIVAMAKGYLDELRALRARTPDDWKAAAAQRGTNWPPEVLRWYTIGEKAWWVLRCDHAWRRKPDAMQVAPGNLDPIAGLYMPGLSYDTDELAMLAAARPDLKVEHRDAFPTASFAAQPADIAVSTADAPAFGGPAGTPAQSGSGTAGGAGAAGRSGRMPSDETITLPADQITGQTPLPGAALDVAPPKLVGAHGKDLLALRGELKRDFEFKYEPPRPILGGWLIVKKSTISLSGKLDFQGQGSPKIVVGGFGNLVSGGGSVSSGAGQKSEVTIAEGKTTSGVGGKVTGGLELGGLGKTKDEEGAQTARGMKAELYVAGKVSLGPVSTELKIVLVGIDETKSVGDQAATGTGPFKILGLKWTITPYEGKIPIPLDDGTTAVLTGTVSFAIEAEPDWKKVAAEVAKLFGRPVVAEEGAVAASGVGAIGAGEAILVAGFAAGAVLTIYAYYRSVEQIEALKDLGRTSNQAVTDFEAGYLQALGLQAAAGNPSSAPGKEGARQGSIYVGYRLRTWRSHEHDSDYIQRQHDAEDAARRAQGLGPYPGTYKPPTFTDAELIDAFKDGWQRQGAGSIVHAIDLAYEDAIRVQIYRAYEIQFPDEVTTRAGRYNALARAGLSRYLDHDLPSDQPDLTWMIDLHR